MNNIGMHIKTTFQCFAIKLLVEVHKHKQVIRNHVFFCLDLNTSVLCDSKTDEQITHIYKHLYIYRTFKTSCSSPSCTSGVSTQFNSFLIVLRHRRISCANIEVEVIWSIRDVQLYSMVWSSASLSMPSMSVPFSSLSS